MAVKKSSTSGENTARKNSKRSTAGPVERGSPTSSGETPPQIQTPLERDILEHLGRYRVSVREVIARYFFAGEKGKASGALGKLQRQGVIQIRARDLDGGHSYYQLTQKGCAAAGVAKDRAAPLSGLSLARSLGVLWFATMNGKKRALLPNAKLPPSCPKLPGAALHVVEILAKNDGRIYRVQVVAEDKDYHYPLAEIRKTLAALGATPEGAAFIESGAYAFAVLVHEEAKAIRFREAFSSLSEPLPHKARVLVERVPSPSNFSLFVKPDASL